MGGNSRDSLPGQDPRPADEGSTRSKLLDVAEARFSQRGYAAVGLRELAEAAGIGKSSLFHHFASKDALYLSVLERVLYRIGAYLLPVFDADGSPGERLERAVDGIVDALAEHPTTARLLLRALFEDDDIPEDTALAASVSARLEQILGRLTALIQQGVDRGDFREVSAAHTVQTLIGATVYHFASGDVGAGLIGAPLFSADAVDRRKQELRMFIRFGLHRPDAPRGETR